MTPHRRNPGGPVRDQLAEDQAAALHTVVDDAVRPYRRVLVWLAIGYAVLVVVSVAQLVLWATR